MVLRLDSNFSNLLDSWFSKDLASISLPQEVCNHFAQMSYIKERARVEDYKVLRHFFLKKGFGFKNIQTSGSMVSNTPYEAKVFFCFLF